MAYGTATIPRVDKIVGPGNIYVATAKKLVFGEVDIDMVAGPSEILILADASADPRHIAADLLSQAEHDELATCVLVTDSAKLAARALVEVERQVDALPRPDIARAALRGQGLIMVVRDIREGMDVANAVAPEHFEVLVEEPLRLAPVHPQRRERLPRRPHPRGARRLPRRAEPRPADGRHGALLLDPRHPGLPEALEHHGLLEGRSSTRCPRRWCASRASRASRPTRARCSSAGRRRERVARAAPAARHRRHAGLRGRAAGGARQARREREPVPAPAAAAGADRARRRRDRAQPLPGPGGRRRCAASSPRAAAGGARGSCSATARTS